MKKIHVHATPMLASKLAVCMYEVPTCTSMHMRIRCHRTM